MTAKHLALLALSIGVLAGCRQVPPSETTQATSGSFPAISAKAKESVSKIFQLNDPSEFDQFVTEASFSFTAEDLQEYGKYARTQNEKTKLIFLAIANKVGDNGQADPKLWESLDLMLVDKSDHVRAIAIAAASHLDSKLWQGHSMRMLNDSAFEVRVEVLNVFSNNRGKPDFAKVANLSSDGSSDVRFACIQAMVAIDRDRSKPILRRLTKDEDEYVRKAAIRELAMG